MTMLTLTKDSKHYERVAPSDFEALALLGGFIDVLTIVFGGVYWFFVVPYNEMNRAEAFSSIVNKCKNSSQ